MVVIVVVVVVVLVLVHVPHMAGHGAVFWTLLPSTLRNGRQGRCVNGAGAMVVFSHVPHNTGHARRNASLTPVCWEQNDWLPALHCSGSTLPLQFSSVVVIVVVVVVVDVVVVVVVVVVVTVVVVVVAVVRVVVGVVVGVVVVVLVVVVVVVAVVAVTEVMPVLVHVPHVTGYSSRVAVTTDSRPLLYSQLSIPKSPQSAASSCPLQTAATAVGSVVLGSSVVVTHFLHKTGHATRNASPHTLILPQSGSLISLHCVGSALPLQVSIVVTVAVVVVVTVLVVVLVLVFVLVVDVVILVVIVIVVVVVVVIVVVAVMVLVLVQMSHIAGHSVRVELN